MILKDILAVSGQPGLFKLIAQGKNSIIVEHLETKKRSSVFNSAKADMLADIAIFTENEDMPLSQVFNLIFDNAADQLAIDGKTDNTQLKKWFESVLPEYDKDRVYVSDIKKVAQWYNTLHKLDMLVKEEPEDKKDDTDATSEVKEEKPEKKKKKTSSKKEAK